MPDEKDVKATGTPPDQKSSPDKQEEKKVSDAVPYERFKEVNDERNVFKQKAEALDTLWQDPEFQTWLEEKETGKKTGKVTEPDIDEEDLDKPLTLREARSLFDKAIEGVIDKKLEPIVKETEGKSLDDAIKEVAQMEKDDEKYPYFKPWGTSKETDVIRNEMIRLMEKEGVSSMDKAYKIATYDVREKALSTKHEEEVKEVKKFGRVRGRSTVALTQTGPKSYKSIREAAEEAAEKIDL